MKNRPIGYDHVDRLFDAARDRHDYLRRCPVTGSTFTTDDNARAIKDKARRALAASDWFVRDGPLEHSLPLSHAGREALKGQFDEGYIVALFARSLAARGWRIEGHVPYRVFASGTLALPGLGERVLGNDASLAERYPPVALAGLMPSGFYEGSQPVSTSKRTRGVATGLY